ncbi:MAG: suppressor of fused domain protein [Chloroflexia bacterium]
MDPAFSDTPLEATAPDSTFEKIWEIRDDVVRNVWGDFNEVYTRRGFAEEGPYVYVSEIPPESQAGNMSPSRGDILRWTYVTGGLAIPWTADLDEVNADDYSATIERVDAAALAAAEAIGNIEWSGQGFEIVMHTPRRAAWAVHLLHNLGRYVMSSGNGFAAGHRVPLNGPIIADGDSALRVLLFAPPADRSPLFKLPSGFAHWLVAVGITQDEWEVAQRDGSAALLGALRQAGVGDLTDPDRVSIFRE